MAPETANDSRQTFIDLTKKNFKETGIDSKKAFIVEIRADWCGECFILEPLLKRLAAEYSGRIRFGFVNVDTNEELTKQFGVTELPFTLFFKNGELVHHLIGLHSTKILRRYTEKIVTSDL